MAAPKCSRAPLEHAHRNFDKLAEFQVLGRAHEPNLRGCPRDPVVKKQFRRHRRQSGKHRRQVSQKRIAPEHESTRFSRATGVQLFVLPVSRNGQERERERKIGRTERKRRDVDLPWTLLSFDCLIASQLRSYFAIVILPRQNS